MSFRIRNQSRLRHRQLRSLLTYFLFYFSDHTSNLATYFCLLRMITTLTGEKGRVRILEDHQTQCFPVELNIERLDNIVMPTVAISSIAVLLLKNNNFVLGIE